MSAENRIGAYIDNGDGTVTDTRTGLMWMRCALGKTWNGATCTGNGKENFTWDQAMALRHDFAGHDDWRLPSIDELKSIVDKTRTPPAIDTIAFPNASDSIFWSSSRTDTHPNYAVVAWCMGFGYGCPYVKSRTDSLRVRLVRGRSVLGILSDDAIIEVTSSPAEKATVAIQAARITAEQEAAATIAHETAERIAMQEAEKQKNPSISIVDSPIREEASGNYIIRSDGTVKDTRTGLVWMRCVLGQTWDGKACVRNEVPAKYNWNQAMSMRHNFAGHNDWRLPCFAELKGVFSAFDTPIFPDCLISPIPEFWSSSLDQNNSLWPLSISSMGTYRGYSEHLYRVRLVRDGQALDALSDDVVSKTTSSPAEEATVAIQPETHLVASTNIIDSPIREEISSNFVVRSDGTVTDTRTGLEWMRCAIGQTWDGTTCTGIANNFTWDQAMALRHDFAGHDDWRLPNIDELKSIVKKAHEGMTVDTGAFPNSPSLNFWSASPYGNSSYSALHVLNHGDVGHNLRSCKGGVRLVRGRQTLGALNDHSVNTASVNLDYPILQEVISESSVMNRSATEDALHLADLLASSTQDVDPIDSRFEHLLREIETRDAPSAALMKAVISNPDIIHFRLPQNRTFLHHAAGRGKIKTTKYLVLYKNANTNSQDVHGHTPLDYAIAANHPEVAAYLRSKGALTKHQLSIQPTPPLRGDASVDTAKVLPVGDIPPPPYRDAPNNVIASPIREEASSNFVVHSDGTVTDTRTGLMWMRCAIGQTWDGTTCTGNPHDFTWDQAMALRHEFAGQGDWRLPDIDELKSIIDKNQMPPAIDTIAFPNASDSCFWSSSRSGNPNAPSRYFWSDSPDAKAWYVFFNLGIAGSHSRGKGHGVRLVRGGQFLDTLNDGIISKSSSSHIQEGASGDYVISGNDGEGSKCLSQDGHAASASTEQCSIAKHWTPKQRLLVQQRAETLVRALKNYLSVVANQSNDRKTREQGLQDARYVLTVLKRFPSKFPFLHLDNLQAVEASIIAVEAETRLFSFGYAAARMTGNIIIYTDDTVTVSGASVSGETDEFFTKSASNCASTDFHIPHLSEWDGAANRAKILESSHSTPAYQIALLTLQLSSTVAIADGDFCDVEKNYLQEQILSWSHLTPDHQQQLLAHLELLKSAPASLENLKKKLDQLDVSARESIAAFMATVAQSDGVVLPAEVKILEKIYKALGVDPIKVFSDLHVFATEGKPSSAAVKKIEETGFTLDPERIIALQRDTEKVSALLAGIFMEEEPIVLPAPKLEADILDANELPSILGLDKSHALLARKLLSRPQWCREELLAMAAGLELMLDGALELINEASFDIYGLAFAEGDDPFVINPEVLEQIEL